MASELDICNRAMQRLGADKINALDPPSNKNARSLAFGYPLIRDAELQRHPWSFARARVQLATLATAPTFGWDYQYDVPADFIRVCTIGEYDDPETEWEIEARKLLVNVDGPLDFVYFKRVTDTTLFDPLFVEALGARLAYEFCEEITQSNTKKAEALDAYREIIAEAKKSNAIQRPPQRRRESSWETARLS